MAGRLRLNVCAIATVDAVESEVLAKFLVVVDEQAKLEILVQKINRSLKRGGLAWDLEAVLNGNRAELPDDELLGDMLRDGEEIFAKLPAEAGRPRPPPTLPSLLEALMSSPVRAPQTAHVRMVHPSQPQAADCGSARRASGAGLPPAPALASVPVTLQQASPLMAAVMAARDEAAATGRTVTFGTAPATGSYKGCVPIPPEVQQAMTLQGYDLKQDSDEEEGPEGAEEEEAADPPGPQEYFEVDRVVPSERMQVDHPCDPVEFTTYDNDWLVENLTPRFREFLLERFQGDLITEPKYVPAIGKYVGSRFLQTSGAFVSVFMRPQTALGSDAATTMPVHYNIPKLDILEFQRRAEAFIERTQQHMDLFRATMGALRSLLAKGKSEGDCISVMLPHTYDAFEEVEGVMLEAERPLIPLGKGGGLHPVIVVDTAGAVGKHLTYVKAALKRALHAHMGAKDSFQLIRFLPSTGEPRLWAKAMTAPTEEALQAAEDWIDKLLPASGGRLLTAVHYALAHQDCDELYIVSSGDVDPREHESVLLDIRRLNLREVPIHTVAVSPEPQGELLLRNISESNHGDFCMKSFEKGPRHMAIDSRDARWTSWRTTLVNEKSKELSESFKKQRMSIGSQIRIIEVMQREESQKEAGWIQEWQCAQRLLSAQEDENNRDCGRDMVKELEKRCSRTLSARVGGGFLYATGEPQLGLERLFEHKSSTSWTALGETTASGPRVPGYLAGQARAPRSDVFLDPTAAPHPAGPPPMPPPPDRRPFAPSGRARGARGGGPPTPTASAATPATPSMSARRVPQGVLRPGVALPSTWSSGPDAAGQRRPGSAQRSARGGGSSARASSEERAAGQTPLLVRKAAGPRQRPRSKTPPPLRERRAPPPGTPSAAAAAVAVAATLPLGAHAPGLERRWSF